MKRLFVYLALAMLFAASPVWADRAQYVPDLVVTSVNAPWTDIRTYAEAASDGGVVAALAAFAIAYAADNTLRIELLVSRDITLSATSGSIIIPSYVTLNFSPGSIITLGAYNLTILGTIDTGRQQIFNQASSGAVSFEGGIIGEVFPEWWGADPGETSGDDLAMIQDAIDSLDVTANSLVQDPFYELHSLSQASAGIVSFARGVYKISGTINLHSGVSLVGTGYHGTEIRAASRIKMLSIGTGVYGCKISDLQMTNYNSTATLATPCIDIGQTAANTRAPSPATYANKNWNYLLQNLTLYRGGIRISDASQWNISNCNIFEAYNGLDIYGPGDSYISGWGTIKWSAQNVVVVDSVNHGAYLYGFVDSFTMINCEINGSGQAGLYMDGTNDAGTASLGNTGHFYWVALSGNDSASSPNAAWYMKNVASSLLLDCHAESTDSSDSTRKYGFMLEKCAVFDLVSCTGDDFYEYGIRLKDTTVATLTGCLTQNNEIGGVLIESSAANVYGITLVGCSNFEGTATAEYGYNIVETANSVVGTKFVSCLDSGVYTTAYNAYHVRADSEAIVANSTYGSTGYESRINTIITEPVAIDGDGDATTLTPEQSGGVFYNITDAETFTLPADANGLVYTFVVFEANNLYVKPGSGDQILGLTDAADDRILSSTRYDTVTLVGLNDSQWIVRSIYPAASDWTDANH